MRWVASWVGLLLTTVHTPVLASSLDQQLGWGAWFNSTRLADRWSLVSDLQLRSSDGWEQVRTLIGRAGISHALTPSLSVAAGYAYIDTVTPRAPTLTEHRAWQQLVLQQKLASHALTHRLRLEQRFIERAAGGDLYSDRLRYFLRLQMPLASDDRQPFTRGIYAAAQNEVFLHLTRRDQLNGQLFDQNRAYAGLGFRWNPGVDVEVGYLHQHLNGRSRDTDNHVVQLALHTRF